MKKILIIAFAFFSLSYGSNSYFDLQECYDDVACIKEYEINFSCEYYYDKNDSLVQVSEQKELFSDSLNIAYCITKENAFSQCYGSKNINKCLKKEYGKLYTHYSDSKMNSIGDDSYNQEAYYEKQDSSMDSKGISWDITYEYTRFRKMLVRDIKKIEPSYLRDSIDTIFGEVVKNKIYEYKIIFSKTMEKIKSLNSGKFYKDEDIIGDYRLTNGTAFWANQEEAIGFHIIRTYTIEDEEDIYQFDEDYCAYAKRIVFSKYKNNITIKGGYCIDLKGKKHPTNDFSKCKCEVEVSVKDIDRLIKKYR